MTHKNSQAILQQAQRLCPGGVHSPVRSFRSVELEPFVVERGEGACLIDVDGNSYIDYVMSWGPLVLGHAAPEVVAAIQTQATKGTSYGACAELETELAQYIVDQFPSIDMLRFVNSGTEATMSAIRLARGFTGRDKIVKFVGCYHGHADCLLVEAGSGALTLGIPGSAGVPEGTTRDTLSAQYNDSETVKDLFAAFPEDIACVILEPIIGNCGMIRPTEEFLASLRSLCDAHGALLIFDEVMTGFRCHPQGAQVLYGVTPDLTCLGKVIGGGLPVGAYGGRQDIMELVAPLGPVYQAGTLSGNPLAMAAGLATLRSWHADGAFQGAELAAKTIVQSLREHSNSMGVPLVAESVGTMFGFFFSEKEVSSYSQAKASDTNRFNQFFKACLSHGVYFAPSAFEAGFTSRAHTGAVLDTTLNVIGQGLAAVR